MILVWVRHTTKTLSISRPTYLCLYSRSAVSSALNGHSRVNIPNKSSKTIQMYAAEHLRFVIQRRQCLRSFANPRAPTPLSDYVKQAIRWSGAGLTNRTEVMACSVRCDDMAVLTDK